MRWLRTVSSRTPNTSRSWWARCTARNRRTATLPGVAPSAPASHRPSPVRSSRATSSASQSARGPCRRSRSRGCSRVRTGNAATTFPTGVDRRSRAQGLAETVPRGAGRPPVRRSREMATASPASCTSRASRIDGHPLVSAPDGIESGDDVAGTGRRCDVMALLLDGSTAGFATSSARPNGRAPGRRRRRRPAWPCARTDGGRPSCGDRAEATVWAGPRPGDATEAMEPVGTPAVPAAWPRPRAVAVRQPSVCSRRWRGGAACTVPPVGFHRCGRDADPVTLRNRDVTAVAIRHGQAERARRQRS